MKWYVYRLYSVSGNLMYIGQTIDLARRLGQHSENYVIGSIKYQVVFDKNDALDLESYLIYSLNPSGNKIYHKHRVQSGEKFKAEELHTYSGWYENCPCLLMDILRDVKTLNDYGEFNKYSKGYPFFEEGLYYFGVEIKALDLYLAHYAQGDCHKVGISCKDNVVVEDIKKYLEGVGVKHFDYNLKHYKKIPTKILKGKLDKGWINTNTYK